MLAAGFSFKKSAMNYERVLSFSSPMLVRFVLLPELATLVELNDTPMSGHGRLLDIERYRKAWTTTIPPRLPVLNALAF